MGRYNTQVVFSGDATAYNGYACQRTCTQSQGTCVLQISGGFEGFTTSALGTPGTGICCLMCVPPGVSSVVIELWGAGGGGGSSVMCQCQTVGSGGGGGSYARKTLQVNAGSCYTICVGAGGAGGGLGIMSLNTTTTACYCGQKGGTTYITGPGLSNLCAEGGYGGESRFPVQASNTLTSPNGGWPGTGGDVNVRGGDGGGRAGLTGTNSDTFTWGGSAAFGGRNIYMVQDTTSIQSDQSGGTGRSGGVNGYFGNFPGGGGAGAIASCTCTFTACGGNGSPGAIRIWM